MAYEMVMPYHLHMPSYFLETFTEYPYIFLSKHQNRDTVSPIPQAISRHFRSNPDLSVAFTGQAISGHDFFQLLKEAQSATIFLINLDFPTMLISFKI